MVKLMTHKSKALPAAHSLEEWHAQALQRYGVSSSVGGHSSSAFLVTPHNAALRIQLRYRVYKEKMRALIKKGSVKDEGTSSSDTTVQDVAVVASSVKTAVRERGVKASSMALAVAYQVRKEPLTVETASAQPMPPLVRQNIKTPNGSGPEMVRPSIQDAPVTWGSNDWTAPSRGFVVLPTHAEKKDDKSESDTEGVVTDNHKTLVAVNNATHTVPIDLASDEDDTTLGHRTFVDVMQPSWLLATVEERCAETAASLGARGRCGPHRQLTLFDLRHTVLDLLFIARSGVAENLHGRAPSSLHDHRRNLVRRVAKGSNSQSQSMDDATHRRVHRMFTSLQSDMVLPAVRCLGWLLTKTWRVLFSGLHVDVASLHRVRQALEAAGNVSVVFTPTHETHLDYLIISYVCFAYGIPLPRIAAGNNLDLPVIGSFLRANGSFFIRRSFKDDPLYKDVLQHYVHELLDDGNPIEVFVEGGRSRHGRVCKPKMGFLNMFKAFVDDQAKAQTNSSTGKDVLLVPISLDYDRVLEVEEYANQLLGKPKQKESLGVFFQSLWAMLFVRCGHCYVRFGEPVSINAYASLKDTAETLAVRMQSCGTITSTAIVSALLMWKRAYTTRDMLRTRAQWLVTELELRGATVANVETVDALVDHALSVLHVHVSTGGVIQSKVSFPTRALELGFYRNHLLHVFLPDMAVLGAIDALRLRSATASTNTTTITLDKAEVLETASFLWTFLRHLCRHEAVDLAHHLETLALRVPALELASDRVYVQLSQWRVCRVTSFALSLHWSFVDSLFLATLTTWTLTASETTSERETLRLAQLLARTLFTQHRISHAEAFCSESLKQAFEFLKETGMICFVACPTTGGRLYSRSETISDETLAALQTRVNSLRKPRTFLYRDDQAATMISRSETQVLLEHARQEATTMPKRGGVYAAWMSH